MVRKTLQGFSGPCCLSIRPEMSHRGSLGIPLPFSPEAIWSAFQWTMHYFDWDSFLLNRFYSNLLSFSSPCGDVIPNLDAEVVYLLLIDFYVSFENVHRLRHRHMYTTVLHTHTVHWVSTNTFSKLTVALTTFLIRILPCGFFHCFGVARVGIYDIVICIYIYIQTNK